VFITTFFGIIGTRDLDVTAQKSNLDSHTWSLLLG
jgi:hypothetical protein